MFNKKIMLSGLSILSSLAIMAGASFALFSDSASSQDNTFSTGSADLQIAEDLPLESPGDYFDSITGMSFSDIAPGFSETKDFWLKNSSSGDFGFDVNVDFGPGVVTGEDLGDALMIGFQCDDDNNGLDTGSDAIVAAKSVNDWVTNPTEELASIGAPEDPPVEADENSDQDELRCRMTASVSEDADNEIAGETAEFDVFFDATQSI